MILLTALNRNTLVNNCVYFLKRRKTKKKFDGCVATSSTLEVDRVQQINEGTKSLISILTLCIIHFFPYLQVVSKEDGLNCEVLESINSTSDLYDVNGRDSPSVPEMSNLDPLPNRKRPAAVIRNQHQVSVRDAWTHASMYPIVICIFSTLIAAYMF
jgi:hypothetical protein